MNQTEKLLFLLSQLGKISITNSSLSDELNTTSVPGVIIEIDIDGRNEQVEAPFNGISIMLAQLYERVGGKIHWISDIEFEIIEKS